MAGPLPLLVTFTILTLICLYPYEAALLAACYVVLWIWRATARP